MICVTWKIIALLQPILAQDLLLDIRTRAKKNTAKINYDGNKCKKALIPTPTNLGDDWSNLILHGFKDHII